ncbi:pseudouridine-5'-phosphate glycosidase, partial [Rhodovulum sulfidophilum]|nr:pseudouridine-5'-phosphate glycosidase [Rhodovulum sulfidophilum]
IFGRQPGHVLLLDRNAQRLTVMGVQSAFWSRRSGLKAPIRLDTAEEIAAAHLMRARLGLPGGQLVANPIPAEAEIPLAEMASVVDRAIARAEAQGVAAKAVTPFLLDLIFDLTEGRSLEANRALVLSNARLATDIARAIARG